MKGAQDTDWEVLWHQPCQDGRELPIYPALRCAGPGPFPKVGESYLSESTQAVEVRLRSSCTHALEIGALLMNSQPGDAALLPFFILCSAVDVVSGSGYYTADFSLRLPIFTGPNWTARIHRVVENMMKLTP